MTLGRLSAVLVVVMTLTSILVLSVRVEEATRNGVPQVWLLYGPLILSSLILFLSFYVAGIRMAMKNTPTLPSNKSWAGGLRRN